MHRAGGAEQDRADGDAAAGDGLEQVVGDVGRVVNLSALTVADANALR